MTVCHPHRIPFHGHSPCSSHDPSRICSNDTDSRSPSQCRQCPRHVHLHNLRVLRNHRPGTFNRHHWSLYHFRDKPFLRMSRTETVLRCRQGELQLVCPWCPSCECWQTDPWCSYSAYLSRACVMMTVSVTGHVIPRGVKIKVRPWYTGDSGHYLLFTEGCQCFNEKNR